MGKDYQRFTDQQGNILSVVDENGGRVFDATYDAWGRQTVTLNTSAYTAATRDTR